MIYIVLFSLMFVFSLIGLLVYYKVKDHLLVSSMNFTELPIVDNFINFFMPASEVRRISIDNIMFVLFNDFDIKSFTLARIIYTFLAGIFSVAVTYTNYLAGKASIFKEYRDLPFLISEKDYLALVNNLTFQKVDYMRDINYLSSNILTTSDVSRYFSVSNDLIYQTLQQISNDLSGSFVIMPFVMLIVMSVGLFYLPDLLLKLGGKLIASNTDMEFFKLESYIYLNCDKSVEELIKELEAESVVFRKLFRLMLSKYRSNPDLTYKMFYKYRGLNTKFKILVEYLHKLESSPPDVIKAEIAINQEHNLSVITGNIMGITNRRVSICNFLSMGGIFLCIIGIAACLLTTLDLGALSGLGGGF